MQFVEYTRKQDNIFHTCTQISNETQYHLLSEIHLIIALTQKEGKNAL